jgi:hypothetical protein
MEAEDGEVEKADAPAAAQMQARGVVDSFIIGEIIC